jgi:hypothetical protein
LNPFSTLARFDPKAFCGVASTKDSDMAEIIKEIRSFEALADDGNRVTIVEFQTVTIKRSINGVLESVNGPIRLALTDGLQVNRVEDKTYKVFHTGKVLRDVG